MGTVKWSPVNNNLYDCVYVCWELAPSYLRHVVTEHTERSKLPGPRPVPWTAACKRRSTGQSQPSAEWQSLPPADDDTAEEWLNIHCVYKHCSSLILPRFLILCHVNKKPLSQLSKFRNVRYKLYETNYIAEMSQEFCNLTSWGISWSRMAKVVRNPTCKKSLINTIWSYLKKSAVQYQGEMCNKWIIIRGLGASLKRCFKSHIIIQFI